MKKSGTLRLCVVIPAHWSAIMGGAQYQAKLLIEYLSGLNRYEIFYVTRKALLKPLPVGHSVIRIPDRGGLCAHSYLCDHLELTKKLESIQPDVIYQRVGCAHTGTCARYARKHRARMVWHIASDRSIGGFLQRASPKAVVAKLDHLWMEYGIRHADVIVAQTRWQQRKVAERYGRRSVLIPNFHHVEDLNRRSTQGPLRIVWVGNLKPVKQPELFIRLAEELGSYDVEFVMVGNWPENRHYDALRTRASKMSNFRYLGVLDQADVHDLLCTADLLVNTSLSEGFSNTFIQAWLCGVPVASYRVDPDDLLSKHGLGFCANGDADELKSWIIQLNSDRSRLGEMGTIVRQYAVSHHSMENAVALERVLRYGGAEADARPMNRERSLAGSR